MNNPKNLQKLYTIMNTSLDWTLIRTFLAVAETGSFSAAARDLTLSQPTIGRHIAQLEDHFGAPLFERSHKGHLLTPVARDILPMAEHMRAAMDSISMTTRPQNQLSGTVRITASIFVAHFVLPRIVAEIRGDNPDIAIEVIPSDHTENLLRREADIALRMYRPTQLDTIARKLGDVQMAAVASRPYLSRYGHPKSADDLANHCLIGYDRNTQIIDQMTQNGIPATRDWFGVRCDDGALYAQMIQAGCGIGFCPKMILATDTNLIDVFEGLPIPPLEMWIAAHESIYKTQAVKAVWDHLTRSIIPLLS